MKSISTNGSKFAASLTIFLLSLVCAFAQTQLIQNGGFDSGTSPWQLSGGATISGYASLYHSSPDYLWLGDDTGTDGAYQTITIPSTASAANLSFYYNINTSETVGTAYDTFSATIADNNGNLLATIANWSNLNGTSAGSYSQQTFNLLAYAGRTIRIYFASNCHLSGSKTTNFRVDDVSVLVTTSTTYTIAVSASPTAGGTVSGGGSFTSGSSQTVTATANSGYTFANWTENGSVVSSSTSYTFTLTGNRTLVANFTQNQVNYTISVSASPSAGGTVSGGGTFASGSSRTVTATANSGYTFANWTENSSVVSSSSSYNFTLNANRTLVANFTTSGTHLLGSDFNADGGSINWAQEISVSPNFMIIKATQGDNPNSFLPSNMSGAPAVTSSFTFGLYDYADPDEYANPSSKVSDPSSSSAVIADAQAAANSYYQIAKSYLTSGHLVPALDLEDEGGYGGFNSPYDSISGYPKWTWSEMAEWIAAWTTQLQQDDSSLPAPILYMTQGYAQNISPQLINSYLSSPVSYQLWVADINDSPNIDPSPSIGSWPTWAIEQYDWTGGDWDALNSSTSLSSLEIQTVTQLPAITSPTPGSTLTSSSATFQWSSGSGVSDYFLYVGTSVGANDLYGQDQGLNQSVTVNNLPQNGSTLYVRLYWEISGVWYDTDYTYTANTAATTPAITSPTPGSTLTSSSATFQWSSGSGVSDYFLYVGSSLGANDIYAQDQGLNQSVTVNNLPQNGSTLYVRLYWEISGLYYTVDYTYTAYTQPTYTVTVSASPSTGGTVGGGGTFVSGSSQTVTATANSGYTFADWTESGSVVSSSASYNFTLNGNRTLVANFTANPVNYTIAVSASPSAGGTVGGGGTFVSGSSQTVTATANSGYTFADWTESGSVVSSSASYNFTLNGNRTLVANFTANPVNYTIAVSASPSAGGTVGGGGTFVSGSSQTVTATANSGYTFANWTESGSVVSSSASYNFTLNGNRTLVANFTANPVNYTIAVSASPSAGGTVSGGGTFVAGSPHTVTATANAGYTFANWTENSSVVSSSASYVFTLNANRNLIANFNVIAPPAFGGISISAGKLQTSLTGLSVGETVVLYGSTDLRNWTPMQTNVASGATVTFTNTVNPTIQGQYFRVGVH